MKQINNNNERLFAGKNDQINMVHRESVALK